MGLGKSLKKIASSVSREVSRVAERAGAEVGRTAERVGAEAGRAATSPVGQGALTLGLAAATGGASLAATLGAAGAGGVLGALKPKVNKVTGEVEGYVFEEFSTMPDPEIVDHGGKAPALEAQFKPFPLPKGTPAWAGWAIIAAVAILVVWLIWRAKK